MKTLKLFFLISIIILIFSCASTDKKTETSANKDQITDNSNLQFGEQSAEDNEQLANRSERSTTNNEQDTTPVELTEDPYVEPSDITEFIAEVAEEPEQTEEIAEAESDQAAETTEEGRPLRTTSLPQEQRSVPREPWLGPQQPAQTPQAQPRPQPPAQTQPPQRQPPVQQAQPPVPQPPVQPLVQVPSTQPLEQTPDSPADTESEPVLPRYVREPPSAPPTRIDSLSQMGTVPNGAVNFSRVVRVTVGQILEIPFRGNGWVYLGELASKRGIAYNSRRNESEGMSFIFNVEEAGTYALKFFREDFTRGFMINDHVQVIASEAPASGTGWFNPAYEKPRITAEPRWPSAIEEAALQRSGGREQRADNREQLTTTPSSAATTPATTSPAATTPTTTALPQTVTPSASTPAAVTPSASTTAANTTPPAAATTPAAPQVTAAAPPQSAPPADQTLISETPPAARQENISPDILLQKAKENFEGQNIPAAIALLDQYMIHYPGGNDELYWMYGQLYEANSPSRNILLSLDYYRRLVNEYPQSSRLTDARRRIAYLERFYINIQ